MLHSLTTTGIGSLPHTDPLEACRVIFDSVDIPFWPQLPHRSFLELMVPQYSEGFPFVRIQGENIIVEKADERVISDFYEAIAKNEGIPISVDYAAGLYAFIEILGSYKEPYETIKGQITGPLTFSLSITDDQKRPIFFDEEMRELSLALLKGKAQWQIELLKPYAEDVLIFVDEPILASLGTSSYIGVHSDDAARMLKDIVDHIKQCGAIAGIHCCGKADWPLVLSSGVDVFNYDSYFFWDSLTLYPADIASFIEKDGFIASGAVPTTEEIRRLDIDGVIEQFERGLNALVNAGVPSDRLRKQILVTPSCGTGSLEIEDSVKVFSLLKKVRNHYVNH